MALLWLFLTVPRAGLQFVIVVFPDLTHLLFAVRVKKVWDLRYPLSAQQRLWSDLANAQADLSLCFAYTHCVDCVMPVHCLFLFFVSG